MRASLFWLLLAAALLVGWALYSSQASKARLNVDPNAAREIEKAQRR